VRTSTGKADAPVRRSLGWFPGSANKPLLDFLNRKRQLPSERSCLPVSAGLKSRQTSCTSPRKNFKVLVSPETGEPAVKKKIRVVQYGVGPIGASIARLMRQKASLEIVGAIDKDPAKAGRDLGEVAGATDAPWGVTVSGDSTHLLAKPVDVVIHSTSSYLP